MKPVILLGVYRCVISGAGVNTIINIDSFGDDWLALAGQLFAGTQLFTAKSMMKKKRKKELIEKKVFIITGGCSP